MSGDPRTPAGERTDDEDHPTDEEQVETEWHLWVIAILVAAGLTLLAFRPADWFWMGILLLLLATVGWVTKTAIERTVV